MTMNAKLLSIAAAIVVFLLVQQETCALQLGASYRDEPRKPRPDIEELKEHYEPLVRDLFRVALESFALAPLDHKNLFSSKELREGAATIDEYRKRRRAALVDVVIDKYRKSAVDYIDRKRGARGPKLIDGKKLGDIDQFLFDKIDRFTRNLNELLLDKFDECTRDLNELLEKQTKDIEALGQDPLMTEQMEKKRVEKKRAHKDPLMTEQEIRQLNKDDPRMAEQIRLRRLHKLNPRMAEQIRQRRGSSGDRWPASQ